MQRDWGRSQPAACDLAGRWRPRLVAACASLVLAVAGTAFAPSQAQAQLSCTFDASTGPIGTLFAPNVELTPCYPGNQGFAGFTTINDQDLTGATTITNPPGVGFTITANQAPSPFAAAPTTLTSGDHHASILFNEPNAAAPDFATLDITVQGTDGSMTALFGWFCDGGVGSAESFTTNTQCNVTVDLPSALAVTAAVSASPTSITTGATSTLTFTLTNPNSGTGLGALSGVADNSVILPSGVMVAATPNASSTCGGTFSPAANAASLTLSGGTLNANNGTCTFKVDVTSNAASSYSIPTGAPTATGATTGVAGTSATLNVTGPVAPTIAAAFSPTPITAGSSSTLTLTITNPNSSTQLTGLAVAASALPANLNGSNPQTTCSGGTATFSGGSLSLSGGTLNANTSCTVTLTVSSVVAGTYTYTTGVVSATGPLTGTTATATLTVNPVNAPTIAAAFSPTSITTAGTSTLTLTIANPNGSPQLTGVAVAASPLPAGLNGSNLQTTCSGTASFSGGSISLTGATLNGSASCQITLTVSSSTPASYTYTTGVVSATGPISLTGTTATASLTITAQVPTIAAAFSPTAITTAGTATLTLTITNPNTSAGLTGLAVAASPLPAGLNGTNPQTTCGGTANFGGSLSLSGGTLAANANCTVTLTVSSTTASNYTYTSGVVSATGPSALSGTTATTPTPLNVSTLNNPNIAAAFSPNSITTSATATLTLTVNNPNTVGLTGVAVAASPLPAGLNGTNPQTTCGGTVSFSAGSLSLSGASVAANSSCTVTLTVSSNIPASYNYTTGTVSATGPGSVTGGTATTSLTVTATAPTIAAAFSPTSVIIGQSATLTLTITNTNASAQLTGLAVAAGALPANLNGSSPQTTCGGTAAFAANSLSLSGGTLNGGSTCTVTLTVSSATASSYGYTSGIVSASGPSAVTGTAATTPTPLSVNTLAAPTIAASFVPTAITTAQTSILTLTMTNPNGSTTLTGLAVSASALPAGLTGSNAQTTCGGTATFGSGNLSLSGGSIGGGGSCTIMLTVSSAAAGNFTFTSGIVSASGPSALTGTTATTPAALAVSLRSVTTTTITSSQNPSSFGQPVTFTATVTATGGTPTGTATFSDGGTPIGSAALSAGVAAFTISSLVVGSHTITASYGGNGNFAVSTSAALAQTVNVPADSVRLRALQLNVTKVVAQNSGQAISGAIDDAISDGFSDNGVFITPGQTSLRFNFAADPVDPDDQPAQAHDGSTANSATAYGSGAGSGDGTPGAGRGRRGSRIDDAFDAIEQIPKKAPAKFREEKDWLFWVDVRGSGVNRWGSTTTVAGPTTTQASLYGLQLNALMGLTYKVAPNLLLGMVGGYETFNYTEQDINGRLTGEGWTVGSYLGWKIVPTLRYDAAVTYSGIGYNGTAGTAQGNFNGERWMAQTGLTGTYKAWGAVFEPSARVYALWENEGAYVDSLGTLQGNHDFATGRASAGGKVIYPFAWADRDILLAPYLGVYGDYYFTEDNAAAIIAAGGVPLASVPLLQGWSARLTSGIGAKFAGGQIVGVGAEYGGIGANFQTWTVKGKAQLPFSAQ